jgi:hypothetical protein
MGGGRRRGGSAKGRRSSWGVKKIWGRGDVLSFLPFLVDLPAD